MGLFVTKQCLMVHLDSQGLMTTEDAPAVLLTPLSSTREGRHGGHSMATTCEAQGRQLALATRGRQAFLEGGCG